MFGKNHGIDLVSGYARDPRDIWGFPLYHPLDGKMSLSKASTAIKNQTFGAGVTKNYFTL